MRIFHYVIAMSLLSLLLFFAGINTSAGLVLNSFGFDATKIGNSNYTPWYGSGIAIAIAAVFAISLGIGIIVGLTGSTVSESFVMGTLSGLLLVFVGDYIAIYSYFRNVGSTWLFAIMSLLFIPMIIGYAISLVEWWRGSD